jgi:hypothetical protein
MCVRHTHVTAGLALLRSMVSSQMQYSMRKHRKQPISSNPVAELIQKIQLAWKIFFPDAPPVRSNAALCASSKPLLRLAISALGGTCRASGLLQTLQTL